MNNIQNQLSYYKDNKEEILKTYKDKVIVISPDLEITEYPNAEDAYKASVKAYGYGNFLIKDLKETAFNKVQIISPIFTIA